MSTIAAPAIRSQQTVRRARLGIVVMLIAGLVMSSLTRNWAMSLQRQAYLTGPFAPADGAGADAADIGSPALGSLDSYFLVLLLGGLRGPLVMFLWTSSESQKNERDLEDFDTKVELIRLLQPEFDSVHIFQMWNKAYNISAQVASLPNKYAVILDALKYGRDVDRARPNNLNILLELNRIYQHKLGSTTGDSVYYHRKIREDTKWRPPVAAAVGALEQRHPAILDQQGNVLANLVISRHARPTDLKARIVLTVKELDALKSAAAAVGVTLPADQLSPPKEAREMLVTLPEADARKLDAALVRNINIRFVYADWNDGGDLQYLKRYEPYLDGVSPLAIGFNYAKRAQVLMNRTGQRPAQSGPAVVDSRPGLELRHWGDSEWDRGMEAEAKAFGRPTADNRHSRLLPTAEVPPDAKPSDAKAIADAMRSLELANRLARDSRAEYTRHLINTTDGIRRMQDYTSHIDTLEADELMTRADLTYLRAVASAEPQKSSLLAQARTDYLAAVARYAALDIRFYIPGEAEQTFFPPSRDRSVMPDWRMIYEMAGFPSGITRETAKDYVDQPESLLRFHTMLQVGMMTAAYDQTGDSRQENSFFMRRGITRLQIIEQALSKPSTRPTQAGVN